MTPPKSKSNKSNESAANSSKAKIGEKNVIESIFNKDNALERRIAEAPPEIQEKARHMQRASQNAYEGIVAYQEKVHDQRVQERQAALMEKYLTGDAIRPDDPEARKQDIEIMKEEAEKQVVQREESYRKGHIRASEANIWASIKMDEQEQRLDHGPQQSEPEMGD